MNDALDKLRQALGPEAVERHAPVDVDGACVGVTLRPGDGPQLAVAAGALERLGLAAIVRGGGTRLGLGNPPRRADLFLSTQRLDAIDELDAGEGVCHAQAGTPLARLREAVRAEAWELPLDPPGEASTVGGTLASAAIGPRCQGFGRPRDVLLGLEVALPSGERVRCGGRVVKNVTGYDLNKVYTGSLGTLGVIEGAWLRLRPRPERIETLETDLGTAPAALQGACESALAASRLATARAAGLCLPQGGDLRLVVELAGDAASVGAEAGRLREQGARDAAPDAVGALRARQGRAAGLRFRLALRPSRLAAALVALRAAGADLLAYPGVGLVYAQFALDGPDARAAAAAAWAAAARAADEAEASFRLEEAPTWAKQERDVFGDSGPLRALGRALKQRFDPGGVLNPGRFAGHL
jgi:glycolate oxidase FAD binding subunit